MKIVKIVLTLFAVSLLAVTFAVGTRADTQFNKRTVVTFNQAVEIPGQILPAGTYTIELYESYANRNIVRIFNADRSELIATVLAVPNYRLIPSQDNVMKFAERPGDAPQALKAWFYPGDKFGQEFVYPKARAVELAQITHETFPAVETEPAPIEELKSMTIMAETPENEEVTIAEYIPLPPRDIAAVSPVHALPKTGSEVPLIALFGALSISIAFALKRFLN